MKKQLNFYPVAPTGCNYKELVQQRRKWTTVRFGDKYANDFQAGDVVAITCGLDPSSAEHLTDGVITKVNLKRVNDISDKDLEGESPDSLTKELLLDTLNAIYERRLGRQICGEDTVTILNWRYLEDGTDSISCGENYRFTR